MSEKNSFNSITGIFRINESSDFYTFKQDEKFVSMEKIKNQPLKKFFKDYKYPLWLLRHSFGIYGKEEDYSFSSANQKQQDERTEELEKCVLPDGNIQNLSYSGIKVPVNPRGYSHAVGPIHAGVIEPGHFRFSVEGSVIQTLHIRLGFQTRNIREQIKGKLPIQVMPFSEVISGDSTIAYATAFSKIYEKAIACPAIDEIKFIRAILLEIERVAIHIGDLGAIAGDVGYYPLHGLCSTDRGVPLGVMEELTGSRFGRGAIWPTEVRLNRKLTISALGDIAKRLKTVFERVEKHFFRAANSSTIRERLQGCGVVSKIQVHRNSFLGMTARSTGVVQDLRLSSSIYEKFSKPIRLSLDEENLRGDAWSRFYLRYLELKNSIDWLVSAIPEINLEKTGRGPLLIQKTHTIKPGVYFSSVEGWRGPVLVALYLDKNGKILHSYIRDPSVLNWYALELAIQGELVADFPLNNKSFNLSYAGFDL